MKNFGLSLILAAFMISLNLNAFSQKEVNKTFDAKDKLKVSVVSGNCKIIKGGSDKISVHLLYNYDDDCFSYEFKEESDQLVIREDFDGRCNGKSDWTITVPENTYVKYNSASGDFSIEGTKNGVNANAASGDMILKNIDGEIDVNVASGDVSVNTVSGTLEISTASGNVEIENNKAVSKINTASGNVTIKNSSNKLKISVASGNIEAENLSGFTQFSAASGDIAVNKAKGAFKLKTASGNVAAMNVELTDVSYFGTASGNVKVKLAKSMNHDLTLSTASGDVDLNYNGNEIKGFFEFTARVDKGKIVSPIKFEKEEVFEKNGKDYDRKSFTKGSASPKVILKTSSGTVKLIK